jgi:hypothetical protein
MGEGRARAGEETREAAGPKAQRQDGIAARA